MPDLLDDLRQSFQYQFENVLDQLAFYKDKVAKQQQVLTRLSEEFKNIKDLRRYFLIASTNEQQALIELLNLAMLLDWRPKIRAYVQRWM